MGHKGQKIVDESRFGLDSISIETELVGIETCILDHLVMIYFTLKS
jgi:hypothetical protein